MTTHPTDPELEAFATEEQFLLFCDVDEFTQIARAVLAKWGAPAQPAPTYKDSTPELHVGDSAFESWYSTYNPAHKSDKQRARDAYAAGMGDPLVMAAPATVAGQCEDAIELLGKYKELCEEIKRGDSYHLGRIDSAISVLAQTAPQPSPAPQADSRPAPVLGTIAHVGTGKTTLTRAIASALRAASTEADNVTAPAATVIKKGADRQWMSERLGHLPDGIYSLYLAPPAQVADSMPKASFEQKDQ